MSSKKKSNQKNSQKASSVRPVKRDGNGRFISKVNREKKNDNELIVSDNEPKPIKKKRYTMDDFYKDVNSNEPNNVKATVKGIAFGIRTFVKNSPHPMTKFINDTMKEIFT